MSRVMPWAGCGPPKRATSIRLGEQSQQQIAWLVAKLGVGSATRVIEIALDRMATQVDEGGETGSGVLGSDV